MAPDGAAWVVLRDAEVGYSRNTAQVWEARDFRCGTKVMFPRDGAWSDRSTVPVGHTQGCSP